ncbi:MAG: division/cell wall cluster transcriptional repressor MraZ [Acidimicrobiales bacterium]|nr:division/cell wall cluster transcriptional repressor MraZ [Acidimicrobiales bacterium]
MVFVNHYEHSLDSKGRVVLPAKYRNSLGDRVYLAPQDSSLALYSEAEFQKVTERLLDLVHQGELDPMTRRGFAANTVEADLDTAGRITIPSRLREYANLTDEVVVNGALTYIEIWDRATFEQMDDQLTAVVQEQFKAGGKIN